jgi:predicted DNA-binding helix-hairpin-helix protein
MLPDGGTLRQLKVLLDNACPNDCRYCAQRAGRKTPRDRFTPEELAGTFDQLRRAGKVDALFLSSGLGGNPVRTMDRMLATVELIRKRYAFQGFVHLKILPGAENAQIERASQLAQRLSINLEAPTGSRLQVLSGSKDPQEVLQRMGWIASALRHPGGRVRSHTTQFVVGAAGESDTEILSTAAKLYREYALSRAYYSAFRPVPDTPLEDHPPVSPLRQHRLYQADFLMRRYGFLAGELPFDPDGNLPQDADPKLRWAQRHPERFPLEINRAEREELMRVPGLGAKSVARILAARSKGPIRDATALGALTGAARKAAPYLLFSGRFHGRQLELL